MKVRDLIAKLEKFDGGLDVIGYAEDESLATPVRPQQIFDVAGLDLAEVRRDRDENRRPQLTFVGIGGGEKVLILRITSDF